MKLVSELLPIFTVGGIVVYLLGRAVRAGRGKSYLKNDLSKDYTRWELEDLKLTAYVALFLTKKVRTNDHFGTVLQAILSRSKQAVDKKMLRLLSVGSKRSTASETDELVTLQVASQDPQKAKEQFIKDLFYAGATQKQIEELKKYL